MGHQQHAARACAGERGGGPDNISNTAVLQLGHAVPCQQLLWMPTADNLYSNGVSGGSALPVVLYCDDSPDRLSCNCCPAGAHCAGHAATSCVSLPLLDMSLKCSSWSTYCCAVESRSSSDDAAFAAFSRLQAGQGLHQHSQRTILLASCYAAVTICLWQCLRFLRAPA